VGIIVAQSLIDKAEIRLNDTANGSWFAADLLGHLNDGQRVIAKAVPAFIKNQSILLVAGVKQTRPADGNLIMSVPRNMGTSGTVAGSAITSVPMEVMNRFLPAWGSAVASSTVENWMYNIANPGIFYVYPPQPTTGMGQVEIVYTAVPPDIAAGAAITIEDVYATILIEYVVYAASLIDADYASSGKAAAALANIMSQLK